MSGALQLGLGVGMIAYAWAIFTLVAFPHRAVSRSLKRRIE